MIIRSTLLAATAALAPTPPAPPAPPVGLGAPRPPLPPIPSVEVAGRGGGGQEVITRDVDGHRVTVVARAPGAAPGAAVLSYRDAQGRDVQVYSDRAVTREEADRLLADARAQGERARADGEHAREQGRMAQEAAAGVRLDAERIRREAMESARESARQATEAARLSARDYADLGDPHALHGRPGAGPQVWIDGRRVGPGFAAEPDVRALREEVRALREELKSVRAELDRTRVRR